MTAAGVLWNGRTRMVVVVFGGLLVLQRSETLDLPKLVYLVAAVAAVLSAVIVLSHVSDVQDRATMRPWIGISLAFAFTIAVSLPVALAHGVALTPWLRTVAGYGLFAVAPILAFDARRAMSKREAVGWMMLAGGLAAISFSIYWLRLRHIADLGIDPPVLPSAQLAYGGFVVAVAFAIRSRPSLPWAIAAGLIFGGLLVTGTRTTFLLLAVPIVLAVLTGRSKWRQTGTALLVGVTTAAVGFFLTIAALTNPLLQSSRSLSPSPAAGSPAASPATTSAATTSPTSNSSASPAQAKPSATARPDLIAERIGSVGTMLVDPSSSQSLTERITQGNTAFSAFAANPLLGAGPGRIYIWTNSSRVIVESYILDTPLMIAAEFGLLGVTVAVGLVGVIVWFVRLASRTIGRGPEYLSVAGLATTFGVTSLLGPPMDDKGAAYALALVLTIVLSVWPATVDHVDA